MESTGKNKSIRLHYYTIQSIGITLNGVFNLYVRVCFSFTLNYIFEVGFVIRRGRWPSEKTRHGASEEPSEWFRSFRYSRHSKCCELLCVERANSKLAQFCLEANIPVSRPQTFKSSPVILHCPLSVLQLEFVSDKLKKQINTH